MKRKTKKWIKKYLNAYNLAIAGAVIIIIVSLIIIFAPIGKDNSNGWGIFTSSTESKEISEKDAKKKAVKEFKKLDEKIKEEDLSIKKIERSGEEYYYIKSPNNTLEIKISTGKVTRINSEIVKE